MGQVNGMQSKEFAITRSSKKKVRSLLIEPSAEEELHPSAQCRLFGGQWPLGANGGKGNGEAGEETTMRDIAEDKSPTNQIRSRGDSAAAINVIATSGNKNKSRKGNGHDGKRLVSLLTILFSSILIVCLMATINAEVNSTTTTIPIEISNSTTATPTLSTATTTSQQVTSAPTTRASTQLDEAINTTTSSMSSSSDSETTRKTTEALDGGEQPDTTTSTSADENDEESATEAEEPATASGGRTLNSKLLVDSASEAADHLLKRLKGSEGNAIPENDEESSAGEAATHVDPMEPQPEAELGAPKPATVEPESSGDISNKLLDSDESRDVLAERRAEPLVVNATTTTTKHDDQQDERETKLKEAFEIYAKWRAAGDDIIELFSRKMLPVIMEHGYDVDSVTVTGLLQVFNGIRAIKPWALKLLDASAKMTPGLLVGTQSDFGDFDECLNIRVDDPSDLGVDLTAEVDEATGLKSSTLVGRYCLADVEFPKPPRVKLAQRNEELQTDYAPIELRRPLLNFSETADFKGTVFVETANFFHMLYVDPIRVGVCLTNKIDPNSFAKVFNQLVKEFGVSIDFHDRCVTKYEKPVWTLKQKVSAYVLLVACSLVLVCTALDLLHAKLNKWPLPRSLDFWKTNLQKSLQKHRPLFTSFSIIRNTKRLFKPQQQKQHQAHGNRSKHPDKNHGFVSSSAESSSLESSPSIERRGGSSPASSAMNLIGGTSSSELSGSSSVSGLSQQYVGKKSHHLLAQFSHRHHQVLDLQHHQQDSKATSQTQTSGELNLVCLHGIRVITMTWMIVNHTYLFGGFFVLWAHRRLIDIAEWPKSLSFQLVLNGWLTVETYFFLSATIIVLNALPLMKAKRFNYLTYIFHRLVRLLPAYVGLVSLNFLWPLISSGPVWLVKGKSFIQTPCENYLWTNFLFINNWIWPEKQCMVHTWFLSADFQLYLMAPILVYLLYRRPILGHSMNIIVAILASVLSGFVIYANKLMPTTLINKLEFDSIKQQLSYSYFATYQHMGPYCLGIFIGYLLYKRPNVQLPKHLTWLLWLLLPPLSFTTLLLTYLWNGAYDDPNLINPSPLVSAVYVAIHRTIWTSLLAWVVFACATGRAKLMSSFLSHSMFVPLSRLSFSIYLVHLPVIMFRALNLRHTIEWTDSNILWEACGNFIASIVIGYFVNVTFESPIINLEQVIFGRPGERSAKAAGLKSGNKSHSGSLMPQLISVSKTSSDNDSSYDTKSAKSTSDQGKELSDCLDQTSVMGDSPVAARNIASMSLETDDSTTCDSSSPQSFQRPSPTTKNGVFQSEQKVALNGVNQMEPLAQQLQSKTPSSMASYKRAAQVGSGMKPLRKLPSRDLPTLSDDSLGSSIYPNSVAEYNSTADGTKPTRYATLARTNRFQHDQNQPMDRFEQQRRLYYPSKSRSYLGATISGSPASSRTSADSTMTNQHLVSSTKHATRLAAQRQNSHHLSRRQTRYNTLSGLGSREWRQSQWAALEAGDRGDWQAGHPVGSWLLQPGTMIPRVDSSTLRRQQPVRNESSTKGSIIEEHEDAAL